MPYVIAPVVYYGATYLGAAEIVAAIAAVAASAAYSDSDRNRTNRQMNNRARDAFNASLRDQTVTVRGSISPSPILYGETALSGPLLYATSTGSRKEYLWMVIGLAMHEVESIGQLYINDTAVTLDGNGDVTTEPFAVTKDDNFALQIQVVPGSPYQYTIPGGLNLVSVTITEMVSSISGTTPVFVSGRVLTEGTDWTRSGSVITFAAAMSGKRVQISYVYSTTEYFARIYTYTGTANQAANADLIAAAPSEWTSAHQLRGVAYLLVRLKYDRNVWVTGIPNVKAIVKGRKCYLPYNNWLAPGAECKGPVAGTPGTLPTKWTVTGLTGSLAQTLVGTGVIDGLTYVDLRFQGTPTASSVVKIGWTDPGLHASSGQTWDASVYVRKTAGSFTGINSTLLHLAGVNASSAEVESTNSSAWSGNTSGPLWANPVTVSRALVNGATISTAAYLQWTCSGSAIDVTLRIARPTLNNTTLKSVQHTSNPVAISWDYLRYGCFTREHKINGQTATQALICDENVQITGTPTYQKRYTFDGLLSTGDERRGNLNLIAQSMAGAVSYSQGIWNSRAGAYTSPAVTITEADLSSGSIEIAPYRSRRDLINACAGKFLNAAKDYQEEAFPEWTAQQYQDDDGAKLPDEVSLPMVTDQVRCQRLAKIRVLRARDAMTIVLPCNMRQYARQAGDMVNLTLARYGFSNKACRVVDRKFSAQGNVDLICIEEPSGLYDWNFGEAVTLADAVNTNLPQPWLVTAPTIVSVVSIFDAGFTPSFKKQTKWYMKVTLDGTLDIDTKEINVEYTSTDQWTRVNITPGQTEVKLSDVFDGVTYQIRARAVNRNDAVSPWVYTVHSVGGTDWVKQLPGSTIDAIFTTVTDGYAGSAVARNSAPGTLGSWYYGAERLPIDPNRNYRVRGYFRKTAAGSDGLAYLVAQLWDANGDLVTTGDTVNHWFRIPTGTLATTFTLVDGFFGADTAKPFPSNARTMTPAFVLGNGSTVGFHECQQVGIEDVLQTPQIKPGAATAVYNAASANSSPCNWDKFIGAHTNYLWDKACSVNIDVLAGDVITAYASVIGTSAFAGSLTSVVQAIATDLLVTGSGKTQWHTDVTDRTGNLAVIEDTNNVDGVKGLNSPAFSYTVLADGNITVYAGGGLKFGSGSGSSSGQVTLRVEHIKR